MYTPTVTKETSWTTTGKKGKKLLAWFIIALIVVLMQWEMMITDYNQAQVTVEFIDAHTIRVTNPTNQPLTGTVVYEDKEVIRHFKFTELLGSKDFNMTGR